MLDLLIIPILICLVASLSIRKNPDDTDFFSRTQTASINGLFVLMIFIRHFSEYIQVGQFDWVLGKGQRYLDQLIVVSFMFFSGYTLALQQAKNSSYIKKLPKKILSLWLMLIVTVLAFLCVQYFLGNTFDIDTILLSMIGYKKVGNSNWYIVAIAILWFLSYIAYSQKRIKPTILMTVLLIIYMIVFANLKGVDDVMYNTVIAYLFGILFYDNQELLVRKLTTDKKIFLAAAVISILMLVGGLFYHDSFILYELWITAACAILVLFCIKIKMDSPVFIFLNIYSLEIYLVQRIPMLVFQGRIKPNLLYFIVSAAITMGLAWVWEKIFEKITAILH
ncbi:MAG: acyltransferase family protein [Anaerolineaceae bacterium]|nr:acyltransferase family protein [Anaerolineaceae bacterium]